MSPMPVRRPLAVTMLAAWVMGVSLVPAMPSESYCAAVRAQIERIQAHTVLHNERIRADDNLPPGVRALMRARTEGGGNQWIQAPGDQPHARAVADDPQVPVRCPDIPVEPLLGGR
jgi:hypothetical protein